MIKVLTPSTSVLADGVARVHNLLHDQGHTTERACGVALCDLHEDGHPPNTHRWAALASYALHITKVTGAGSGYQAYQDALVTGMAVTVFGYRVCVGWKGKIIYVASFPSTAAVQAYAKLLENNPLLRFLLAAFRFCVCLRPRPHHPPHHPR